MTEHFAGFDVHPAASLFPLIEGDAFDAFVEDIRANGQAEAIVISSARVILDGRNRARACDRLGIRPMTRVENPENVTQYVISHNLHRRHFVRQAVWCVRALVDCESPAEKEKPR